MSKQSLSKKWLHKELWTVGVDDDTASATFMCWVVRAVRKDIAHTTLKSKGFTWVSVRRRMVIEVS